MLNQISCSPKETKQAFRGFRTLRLFAVSLCVFFLDPIAVTDVARFQGTLLSWFAVLLWGMAPWRVQSSCRERLFFIHPFRFSLSSPLISNNLEIRSVVGPNNIIISFILSFSFVHFEPQLYRRLLYLHFSY